MLTQAVIQILGLTRAEDNGAGKCDRVGGELARQAVRDVCSSSPLHPREPTSLLPLHPREPTSPQPAQTWPMFTAQSPARFMGNATALLVFREIHLLLITSPSRICTETLSDFLEDRFGGVDITIMRG